MARTLASQYFFRASSLVMNPRVLLATGLVASCIVAVSVWALHGEVLAPERLRHVPDHTPPVGAAVDNAPLSNVRRSTTQTQLTLRERFRASRDYAEFIRRIEPAARAGDVEAEFLVAEALKYCDENVKRFFRTRKGAERSLDDAQLKWAHMPAGYQHEIVDVYDRCQAFLADPEMSGTATPWRPWLDKAAAAGYAPAQAEKADGLRVAASLGDGADPAGQEQARALALLAVKSGDPDAVVKMANWVSGKDRSPEEYGDLVSAWQLLACQRGYDCGPRSEWLRSMCNWDPQCADGQSVEEYLQRQLGSRYDEVRKLAAAIGNAVDEKNTAAIQPYL